MFEGLGIAYLEQLLRAAIDGEAARAEPGGGRIAGSLIWALVSQGAADRVEWYLRCDPDWPSTYEVACFDCDHRPVSRVESLEVGQAIRMAAYLAETRPTGKAVVVISHDHNGGHRCVLLASGTDLTLRFPATHQSDATVPAAHDHVTFDLPPRGGIGPSDVTAAFTTTDFGEITDIEELTRDVNEQLGGNLYGTGGQDIVDLLGSMIPSAAEIAELVVNQLSANSEHSEKQVACDRRSARALGSPRRRRTLDPPQDPRSNMRR